jgi:hypothetical protein
VWEGFIRPSCFTHIPSARSEMFLPALTREDGDTQTRSAEPVEFHLLNPARQEKGTKACLKSLSLRGKRQEISSVKYKHKQITEGSEFPTGIWGETSWIQRVGVELCFRAGSQERSTCRCYVYVLYVFGWLGKGLMVNRMAQRDII